MAEVETPPQGETKTEVTSNNAEVPAQGAGTDLKADEVAAQLAEANKRAQQAEMRARQLENERTEAERKAREAEGNFQKLYEDERQRNEDLQKQREMDDLMSQYPPEVQAVAKKLFTAGDLSTQLAALNEAVKQVDQKKNDEKQEEVIEPPVTPMNPNPSVVGQHQSILKPEMSLDDMAEALDKKTKGLGL